MKKIEYSQPKRVFKTQIPKKLYDITPQNDRNLSKPPPPTYTKLITPTQQYQSTQNFKTFKAPQIKQPIQASKQYARQQRQIISKTPNNYNKIKFDFDQFENNSQSIKKSDQRQKSKGIQITTKSNNNGPIIIKNKENDDKSKQNTEKRETNIINSQSQGKLINNQITKKLQAQANSNLNQKKIMKDEETFKSQINEYKHLHDKLNNLQTKILKMKNNLEKKRQDKKTFLEAQQKERKKIQMERKSPAKESKQYQLKSNLNPQNKIEIKKKEITNQKISESALKQLVTQVPQHKQFKYFEFNPYSPKHNIYYVSEIVRAYKQQKSLARQHLLYSMQLLKIMQNVKRGSAFEIASKNVNLVQKSIHKDKKTIVFDLDQTLIHCNQSLQIPYDIKLPIKFPTGEVIEAGINIRPYAVDILKNLSVNFEIIIFTASHSCYANVVLDYLDPENKYIQHRLFRQHCYATAEGMFVKDLRVINRNMSDMVLVDNAAYSYAFQLDNGIPIIPYYEGKNDYQLKALQKYIQNLMFSKDVRESNRKTFKLDLYKNYDDPQKLVNDLYLEGNK